MPRIFVMTTHGRSFRRAGHTFTPDGHTIEADAELLARLKRDAKPRSEGGVLRIMAPPQDAEPDKDPPKGDKGKSGK